MLEFSQIDPIDRVAARAAFASKNPETVCNALLSLTFHDPDWRWVQDTCLTFIADENVQIRGLAATCLGHLARIHRTIDSEPVKFALRTMLSNSEVSGQAQDALDDIEMFVEKG